MKSEVYILEDNQEYELVDSIEEKNAKYLLLLESNNYSNICIRKEVGDLVEKLTDEEYTKYLKEFVEKNKNLV